MSTKRERPKRIRRIIVFLVVNSLFTAVVAMAAFAFGWTTIARSLPDLSGWHTDMPGSEFSVFDAKKGYSLDDYLAQETKVFEELEALRTGDWASEVRGEFSRFKAGSASDPDSVLDRNWNRSRVLRADKPVGGALLLHGLSDSPYSLRVFGERLHAEGWTVVWLRVPGHGTCPGALTTVNWRDWIAAVRIAARGVRDAIPDAAPLVLVGFSNGGALATEYAASAVMDDDVPNADAVVLYSPMIGISALAQITRLYPIIGRISGLEKVVWSKIEAEIDPFKYSSWPMNANVQAWLMTQRVEKSLARLQRAGRMDEFPPVLACQSAVDSTVAVPVLIGRLFDRLTAPGSELLLVDVNRVVALKNLLNSRYAAEIMPLLEKEDRAYVLTILSNVDNNSAKLTEHQLRGAEVTHRDPDLEWPNKIFSLSHNAMPIPDDDPILGTSEATAETGLPLGSLDLRGETGVLMISESQMIRLRHNPFYEHIEEHTIQWLERTLGFGTTSEPD